EEEVSSDVPIDTIAMPIRITFDFNDHFSKPKDLKKDLTISFDSTTTSILPHPSLDSDSPFTAELSANVTLNSLGNEDKVFKPGILVYQAIHDKNLVTLEENLKENISSGTLLVFKEPSFLLPPPEPPDDFLKNVVLNFYQSNVEDVNSFTFIIWIFLPYFTYTKESPLIFSFRCENFVFDPGIITFHKPVDSTQQNSLKASRDPVDLSRSIELLILCTDISKLTRKQSKTGKHGHENGRVSKSRKKSQAPMGDALSRKERVKSRRVRGMILAAQSEAFKQENVLAERLHGLDQQMERKGDESLYFMDRIWVLLVGSVMDEAHASSLRYLSENEIESPWILSLNFQGQSNNSKEWNSGDDQLRLRWMIYLVVLADAAESVRDAIGFEYCLASSSGWTKSPVLWAEIGESSLTGLELVQETTDKVVLVKEKPKAARDRQKSYADKRRKPLEFEVGPFEILERIGLVAYRLRLPEELSSVHDTFHVSNLKKCLADANLHVPLDEIKVDKTLHFVEEPVEIMDREIRKLKRRNIALVKVRWNSKRGPEFT
ncbi:hypothetical protein Tco_1482637, partial [Tanacetum coccineum]